MSRPSIGLLVLARDEEENLPRCLASAEREVDEIVVVDMASEDGTADIARRFGATVVGVPVERYFDLARRSGLEALNTEWVMQMDADEWAPELLERVRAADWLSVADALRCPRLNYLAGEVYPRQGWWPNMQVRLFKRHVAHYVQTFHRFLRIDGSVADLPARPSYAVHHLGAGNAAEMISNAARYLPHVSAPIRRAASLGSIGKPLMRYTLSRGWRDGSDGGAIFAAHVLNEIGRRTSSE